MSSTNEILPEQPTDNKAEGREFSAPNGEYVAALAIGKLMHFPGFEMQVEDDAPTDDLPNAS